MYLKLYLLFNNAAGSIILFSKSHSSNGTRELTARPETKNFLTISNVILNNIDIFYPITRQSFIKTQFGQKLS